MFSRKDYLNAHIAAVHEKKNLVKCSMCPSKFANEGQLTKHITALHEKKIHELEVTCQSKTYENRNTNEKLKSFEIFLK